MIIKSCKPRRTLFAPFAEELLEEEERQAVQKHLQEEDITLPEGFQARLMQRITTGELAVDALDFSWQGLITTLLQLLEALFSMLSGPQPAAIGQPA
ncbi:MAG: hypothetical protein H8D78_20535 [Chloroflexi bacterium]|nr:hypothetical protein [Chloroflexota bacterium]